MIKITVANTAEGAQTTALVRQTNPQTNLPTQPDTMLEVGQSADFFAHQTNSVHVTPTLPTPDGGGGTGPRQ